MPRRTAQDAAKTRSALIDAGVAFFTERPYREAPLEELVGRLGVTRGALYHHFGSKQGLFEAVLERTLGRLGVRIEQASSGHGHGWSGLEAGCRAFLAAATDRSFRRIVLVDGPSVLGWRTWKEIDDRTAARTLRDGLDELRRSGHLRMEDAEALAVALSGAMNELALWVANHDSPRQALGRAEAVVVEILGTFRHESDSM